MSDPRKNRPSASGFHRLTLCPGSFELESQVPEGPPDKDAESGTRVHSSLAKLDWQTRDPDYVNNLDQDEYDMVRRCETLRLRFFEMIAQGEPPSSVDREKRLWAFGEDLRPLYSGQPDGVALWEDDTAAVWDFKTGRVPVPPAEINWQLRSLAALVAENYLITGRIVVAIIQPWVSPGLTMAEYTGDDLQEAMDVCEEIALRALSPGQPRIPGEEQCRHCRAKAHCPEAMALVKQTAMLTIADGPDDQVVDGNTLSKLLEALPLVRRLDRAITARAKAMLAEHPDSVPGYRLKPGVEREKIVKVGGVWIRASALGIDAETFTKACSLTKKNVTALVRTATGDKGKALENRVRVLIADCVEKKTTAPKLLKIGAAEEPEAIEEGNGDE